MTEFKIVNQSNYEEYESYDSLEKAKKALLELVSENDYVKGTYMIIYTVRAKSADDNDQHFCITDRDLTRSI